MIKFLAENQQYLEKILILILVVGFLVLGNIASGIYYNVGKNNEKFDIKKLFYGIIKAITVLLIVSVLTISYLSFVYLNLIKEDMIDPLIICYSAATYYFINVSNKLIKIFGIKINKDTSVNIQEIKTEMPADINKEKIKDLLKELNEVTYESL